MTRTQATVFYVLEAFAPARCVNDNLQHGGEVNNRGTTKTHHVPSSPRPPPPSPMTSRTSAHVPEASGAFGILPVRAQEPTSHRPAPPHPHVGFWIFLLAPLLNRSRRLRSHRADAFSLAVRLLPAAVTPSICTALRRCFRHSFFSAVGWLLMRPAAACVRAVARRTLDGLKQTRLHFTHYFTTGNKQITLTSSSLSPKTWV